METQIRISGNSVYWRTFKWGQIIPEKSLFKIVPRTNKNIFVLFQGLGLNEEILFMLRDLRIKFIEVRFNNSILKTTTDKWLKHGIKSRYCDNRRVDQQLIMPLSKLNLDESKPSINQPSQLNLFVGAS